MPVGGKGGAGQTIKHAKIPHTPVTDKVSHASTPVAPVKPSHVSTRHTAVHVPLVKSFKIKPGDSCPGCTDTTGAHGPSLTFAGSKEMKVIGDYVADPNLAMALKKADKNSPWMNQALESGQGLTHQGDKLYAAGISQTSWIRSPWTAAHVRAGVGIPNYDQLMAAQADVSKRVGVSAPVKKALKGFYTAIGHSDLYLEQLPGGTGQLTNTFLANKRLFKQQQEKKEGKDPARIKAMWGAA